MGKNSGAAATAGASTLSSPLWCICELYPMHSSCLFHPDVGAARQLLWVTTPSESVHKWRHQTDLTHRQKRASLLPSFHCQCKKLTHLELHPVARESLARTLLASLRQHPTACWVHKGQHPTAASTQPGTQTGTDRCPDRSWPAHCHKRHQIIPLGQGPWQ